MQSAAKVEITNHRRVTTTPKKYSKDQLLLLATRRFVGADEINRLESTQYKEAFHSLIADVTAKTRQEISTLLGTCLFTPRDVFYYLTCEPLHVAEPLLSLSPVPNQLDLLRIIEKTSLEHCRVIATRPDLGPALVQHLQRLNDAKINILLQKNGALKLRPTTAEPAKPIEVAECKKRVASSSEPKITYTITRSKERQDAQKPTPSEKLVQSAARGNRLATSTSPSKRLTSKSSTSYEPVSFESGMERAALKNSRQAMSVLMQKKFGLSFETCHQVLEDKSGKTLSVLLKAASVEASLANRITLLTYPTIGLSVKNARAAVEFYAQLETSSCGDAVDQWPKQEVLPSQQHDQLHSDDPAETRGQRVTNSYPVTVKKFGEKLSINAVG